MNPAGTHDCVLTASLTATYQALSFDQRRVQLRADVVQVPLEAVALEPLPQTDLLRQVPYVSPPVQQVEVALAVEQILVVVQPHLGHPGQVPLHRLLTVLGELVGVLPPEDVTHPGAGDDLDLPSTHPDLRAQPGPTWSNRVWWLW